MVVVNPEKRSSKGGTFPGVPPEDDRIIAPPSATANRTRGDDPVKLG
jgi:hypothetical protein